jgi:hypothetical protein
VTDPIPEWESARPQWEQELGDSQARQHMNEIVQRPWTTVNSPATMPIPTSQPMNDMNSLGTLPSRTIEQRNSMGWATVNQPTSLPGPQKYERASSTAGSFRNLEQVRREDTVINEEGSVPLIDTLPKSKQRQVYGQVLHFCRKVVTLIKNGSQAGEWITGGDSYTPTRTGFSKKGSGH